MRENVRKQVHLEEMPPVSQKLKLICRQCGQKGVYDVGTIYHDQEGKGRSAVHHYAFSHYFRCAHCGSPGPWDVADLFKIFRLALRATVDRRFAGLIEGHCVLFDGTVVQTPAMGEEYLLNLIQKKPRDGFLCARLANLYRSSGQTSKASQWYQKALSLNPGDIEARYHLFRFALQANDLPAALAHGPLLVRHFLEGHTTKKEDLTQGLALAVAEALRGAPESFRNHFSNGPATGSNHKEDLFIRTLLAQEGEEEEILADAAERLLSGIPIPALSAQSTVATPNNGNDDHAPVLLVPSLQSLVQQEGLDPEPELAVGVDPAKPGQTLLKDRHMVPVTDGSKAAVWSVPTLRELFRGHRAPPPDAELAHYPPAYCPYFFFVERHVLAFCAVKGDLTDQEMEEAYAMLRRRPDGKSLGELHDFLWRVAALLLGTYVLSEAEFEAVFSQLERSVRHWALRPVSRNYTAYLHKTFERGSR